MPESHNTTNAYGWVFYDAHCRICSGLINRLRGPLVRRGYLPVPLQRGWVQQRLGLSPQRALDEMRVLTARGEILGGTDAVVHLAKRIWWGWPLAAAAQIPGAFPALRSFYRFVARRRCRSGQCKPEHQP
ncbi:MAG: thiol-disulfide oxidoreductase DCC family protein [Planctomycetota bacterium]|jgi:predicted DCC family thiol-disulfide oxidoreductase YuxK